MPPQQNQFSERQRKPFCSSSWTESAVPFGSMPSEAERLGDVDIAIELLPKVTEEAADQRRSASEPKITD
jgi:hypothetical protein